MISMDPILTEHVLSLLGESKESTIVSQIHNNSRHEDKDEVQAFAKLSGRDWTYYISSLRVSIGRGQPIDSHNPGKHTSGCDIDLGPAKIVSRKHADIVYNQSTGNWELHVNGRNGAKINFTKVESGPQSPNIQLFSGTIIDINGTQMMFILPDTPPMLTKFAISSIQQSIPLDHPIYKLGFPMPTLPIGEKPSKKQNKNDGLIDNHAVIHKNSLNTVISSSVRLGSEGASLGVIVGEKISKNAKNFSEKYDAGTYDMDQDLSKDEHRNIKPSFSYATLITQAFLSTPEGEMALADIYKFISDNYAYFRFKKPNWQNSVRHNLSLNKAFERVDRRSLREIEEADDSKKQDARRYYKWRVAASFQAEFIVRLENGRLGSLKRGTSIVNQLHKYYSIHGNLPTQVYYPEELLKAYNDLMGSNGEFNSATGSVGGLSHTAASRKSQISSLTQTANKIEKASLGESRSAQSDKLKHNVSVINSHPNIVSMSNIETQNAINNNNNNQKYLKPIMPKPTQPLMFAPNSHAFKVENSVSSNGGSNNENGGNNNTNGATSPNKTHLLLNAFQHQENLEREQQLQKTATPARPSTTHSTNTANNNDNSQSNKFSDGTANTDIGSTAGNNIQEVIMESSKKQIQQPYSATSNNFSPGVMNLLQFSSVNNTPAIGNFASNMNRSLKKTITQQQQPQQSNVRLEGEEDEEEEINSSPLKRKKQNYNSGIGNSNVSLGKTGFMMPNVLDIGDVRVTSTEKKQEKEESKNDEHST